VAIILKYFVLYAIILWNIVREFRLDLTACIVDGMRISMATGGVGNTTVT